MAGTRHGVLVTGILGGLLSSTAATVTYGRRSRESPAMERLALAVVPLANLVPLARVTVFCAVVAPALLASLAPVLGAALAAGMVDIDPIALSALNLFGQDELPARAAATAISLAYLANVGFKLAVLVWFNRRLAWRALWPLAATVGAGAAAFALVRL